MRAAFVLALVLSLALNAWLIVRERTAETASPSEPARATAGASAGQRENAKENASANARATRPLVEGLGTLAELARAIEESKRTAGPKSDRMIVDAQCRVAREKAAEAWRREAPGIQRAILAWEEPTDGERASQLQSERDALADAIGVEADDAAVRELAEKRMELKSETSRRWKEALGGDPPDWRTGVDLLLDFYRRSDAEGLRVLGVEKAADVRIADLDERAALLALGASLVDEPWETTVAAAER